MLVSTVILKAGLAALSLPALSVTVTVIEWLPSLRPGAGGVKLHEPSAPTLVVQERYHHL
nr:hypothetical protein [Bartonella sp. HY038]